MLLRQPLRRSARTPRPALGSFLRYLWPVVVGLIGLAVLTNVDLLVVKARFSDDAGAYAAASAFARVAFFLPATILAVLFPRTAARQARGEDTADILGRSLLVTAAFGGVLTLFYAMAGRGLVHTSFGADFASGGELLVPFTISMALFALANVLVGFHLSRDETRYAWIVACFVPAQLVLLALLPNSVRQVIWVDVALGLALLASHEIFVESSVPALTAGLGRLRETVWLRRRHVAEALVATASAAALVCVLFWSLVSSIGSSAVGGDGSDAAGTIGWLWRLRYEGYHLFGTTVHKLTGAPIGWEQTNGLNLQWLLPYYPAYLATKVVGEVTAYNLVVLTGFVLSGVTMYLLVRYLGCSRLVGAWAGIVFIVFPWHLERAVHASLVHLEILVLLLLALVAAADRPIPSRFALVGLATLAAWLTSGYFGVMAVVGAVAFAIAASVVTGRSKRLRLVLGTTASALAATTVLVVGATSSGVGSGAGLQRQVEDLSVYGLRPIELLVPSADNLVAGDHLASIHAGRLHGSNPIETSNYLGLLTIGLAAGWIFLAWRRRGSSGAPASGRDSRVRGRDRRGVRVRSAEPDWDLRTPLVLGTVASALGADSSLSSAVPLDGADRDCPRTPGGAGTPGGCVRDRAARGVRAQCAMGTGGARRCSDRALVLGARREPHRGAPAHAPRPASVRSTGAYPAGNPRCLPAW